jgi:hypothetical protein
MSKTSGILLGAVGGIAATVLTSVLLVPPRAGARAAPACPPISVSAAAPATARTALGAPAKADVAAQIRQKEAELAALRATLDATRAAAADAEKRAEAVEGKPRDWPADLLPAYRGEALEARLNTMLQKTGLGTLADLNCDEYPCVAVIQAKNGSPHWQKDLQAALQDLAASGDFGSGTNISMWGSHRETPDGNPTTLSAVALTPKDDYDDELHKRTSNRAGAELNNLGH